MTAARSVRPRSRADKAVSPRAWPLRTYLEVDAEPQAVRSARLHAATAARRWRLGPLADTVELVVSEIVTNAMHASVSVAGRQGPGPASAPAPVRCWLASDRQQVMIHVWDPDRHRPVTQEGWPDGETGRGLLLVATLCTRWGCYSPDGRDGKVVWALCAAERPAR